MMQGVYYVCGYCKTGLVPVEAPVEAGTIIPCACEIEYMRTEDGQWWAQIQEPYAHLYRGVRDWAPVMDMPRLITADVDIRPVVRFP